MKTSQLKKLKESGPKVRKKAVQSHTPREDQAGVEAKLLLETWQSELDQLSGREFETLDSALEFLVEQVLVRMQVKGPETQEIKDFLKATIETDQEMVDCLYETLQIKERRNIE